jgi:ATP/maltotriose-dependent transcriptional regulator MalT
MVDCLTKKELDLCAAQQRLPEVLTSYLDREVFHGVPEEIMGFLSKIAVFSEFTPDNCDQLLGISSSEEMVRYLKSHQLLLEGKDDHYGLIPLIRSYLLSKLGPERSKLFKKDGTIAIGKGSLDQAINCFLKAGDRQTLADVLVRFGGEAVVHGHWQDVAEWSDSSYRKGNRD